MIPGPDTLFVFDMAGTTVAVADEVPAALRAAFGAHGFELSDEMIRGVRGRSKREAVHDLVRAFAGGVASPGPAEDIHAAFIAALQGSWASGVRAMPGALDVMRWLRSTGAAVALTTGFDSALAGMILGQLDWGPDVVDVVITADDVEHGRPHPEPVLRAMSAMGVSDPANVAVIGDTSADLECAARAGVSCIIGVLSGAHGRADLEPLSHTVLLNSVADLPAWLAEQQER